MLTKSQSADVHAFRKITGARETAPILFWRGTGGGSVINIGSVLAYVGEPKLGAYSVSKGALMTFTKNAASLLNRDRIRVNQINVGWTLTEGERRVKHEQEGKGDEWIEQAIATRPFGRLLRPLDVARGVLRDERERMRHRKRSRPRAVPAGGAPELVSLVMSHT